MTIRIDIQHATEDTDIPDNSLIIKWASKAVLNDNKEYELTIRIVGIDEATQLNETWRNKKGPTNVLSFQFDGNQELAPELLGDIVICSPVLRKEADLQDKSLEAHWAHMVIHETLHLQGYKHDNNKDAEIMESLEIELLDSLGYTNPYEGKIGHG